MNLTTRTRVLAYINVDQTLPASTTIDSWLDARIEEWSLRAEAVMDRTVTTATYTEYLDSRPGQLVFTLKAYPIDSVTSLTEDTEREFTGSTIAAEDYSYQAATGLVRLDGYAMTGGPGSLKVVYVGGMAATAASFVVAYPEIAAAIDAQVAYVWERRQSAGRTQVSAGPGSASYNAPLDWLPHVRAVLLRNRRMSLGG